MTPIHPLRAVLFDFDGTLAHTKINFARMRDLTVEHIRQWGLFEEGCDEGRFILEVIDWAKAKLADRPEDQARYAEEAKLILEQVELETCATAEPFPGVQEALHRLKACGYRVGIITRNCRVGVKSVLDRFHLEHEVLLTRDDLVQVKPDPEHMLMALRMLGIEPQRAALVGDHTTDIQCALAAGGIGIGVLTDRTTREQLQEAGAAVVLDDVPAVAALLCDSRP
jgi:phosphoglycolate phosphatase